MNAEQTLPQYEVDLSIPCCLTCQHWTQPTDKELLWGRCVNTSDDTNEHNWCDGYEPI